jgi:site-specific DNA-cytosine methylase
MTYTVGSLFAGIAGFDVGFERAGFTTIWQVERDGFCRKVLAKRFPKVDRSVTDVFDAGKHNLCSVDVIVGGDPCQRNSNAWRHGSGAESPASEFLRIVDELRPRVVVRENPSVVRKDAPWPWWRFRAGLERIGYGVLPLRLRACCVGSDHRRERLFLLAALPDSHGTGLERYECEELAGEVEGRQDPDASGPARRNPAPRVCGRPHGIPNRMDRLRALGNSADPYVTEMIARRIKQALDGYIAG